VLGLVTRRPVVTCPAGEEWRPLRLINDASRDPDELLAEGIALSLQAADLASAR